MVALVKAGFRLHYPILLAEQLFRLASSAKT